MRTPRMAIHMLCNGCDIILAPFYMHRCISGGRAPHYGRTVLCRAPKSHGKGPNPLGKGFAVWPLHGKECTATIRPAKAPLPCVERKSHGKGFAVRPSFAVRCACLCRAVCFAVRWASLPCPLLCRAPPRQAARQTLGFAVCHHSKPHGKESYSNTRGQHRHPLPCACARQRKPLPCGFLFAVCMCMAKVLKKFQVFAVSI
jgi:hypothetical protein